jgi:TRAP-type C4-dicarboxylate transport system permease large subunit
MDFHLLTRVGCSMALKHAKPQKAALAALGWVMLPGILGLLLMAVILMGINGGGDSVTALHFGWVVWCLLAAMIVHRRSTTELSHFEGVRTSRFLDPVGQSGIHPVPGRTPVTEPTGN